MKKNITIEQSINLRFLEVMAQHVGPGKKWKFKRDFAGAMNMRPQELYKIEKGSSVQIRFLIAIHELTGVDLNYLMMGKKEQPAIDIEGRLKKLEIAISKR